MSVMRILQTAQVTVTKQFWVDEVLTDLTGNGTATLKRLDGTTVNTVTATHPSTGTYQYVVPGQALLDMLTLDWTGTLAGAAISVRDHIEIVGGHYFGLPEVRAAHTSLASTSLYPSELLALKRIEIEQEFDGITRMAFVPRFARHYLSGTGGERMPIPQNLPHRHLRAVRAVAVDGVAWSAPDVAAVTWSAGGVLYRAGGGIWPAGHRNIVVEWEHGLDYRPEPISAAGILRMRSKLAATSSGVPDRAVSFASADGGTYRLSTPDRQRTGVPEVDGVLAKYTRQRRAVFA